MSSVDSRVDQQGYDAVLKQRVVSEQQARREQEFVKAEDAFSYAASLADGVVLDWGYCYAAMEREGLNGFAGKQYEEPIVTPPDLLARPGPNFILARRNVRKGWLGGFTTDFADPKKSWSDDVVEVIEDGTGHFLKGQRLYVRVLGNMGERISVGSNWRMKFFRLEDVVALVAE
jgi:hypothetical protein